MVAGSGMLVAVDDGYAQTKLWGEGRGADGAPVRFMMRSSARPGRHALVSLSGDGSGSSYRTEEGEDFTVSDGIEGENTQFDGFHLSTLNRVLVHHALASAGYGGKDVNLVVGLPVADYFSGGRRNERKIEAKKANLLRGVSNLSGDGPEARIVSVEVGCQALAAYYDYALDDAFQERDVPTEKVAVVDIGGRTTDVALVLDGSTFDPSRSGTSNMGVLDVYKALNDLIKARFETRDDYPLALLDRAVRTGTIKMLGKPRDITDLVEQAVREQQVKIAREVERKLGGASDLDCILFVGGGSMLFTKIAETFEHGVRLGDGEFANSRGMFKNKQYFR